MRRSVPVAFLLGWSSLVAAQAPPGTDVFLVDFAVRGSEVTVGAPVNLTKRAGYDNQPGFAADGRSLFYTSVREGGPKGTTQSDIYRVDLASRTLTPFIQTTESEYSATVTPDGKDLAVIRVEQDSTQRLWAFPLKGGEPRVLLPGIKPVGYQTWLDAGTVGIFVLGSPPTLQVASVATGQAKVLLADIGRALQRVPGKAAIAVSHRASEGAWWAVEVDVATAALTPIVRLPAGADFFVWLPDRSLLAATGSTLIRYRPGTDSDWATVAQWPAIKGITRLAVSPKGNQVAFVAEDAP